jgi:paraquat-inducible protein B
MLRTPVDPEISDIPEAIAERKRRWTLPLVWLIPAVALVIGAWLAVKAVLERGPTITISFKTAEGLEAGKTKIKYKNVDVGEVRLIKVSKDRLQGVIATAELVNEAKPYLVEDTRFWIVRPRIAGGQVSGLGTLFSGSYIGVDLGKSDTPRQDFVGLEAAPIITGDIPGRQFILHSKELGSAGVGAPVFFRQVEVGSVVAYELNKDGKGVTVKIFVTEPYDQHVTSNTRFWNASGIDIAMDATGIKVDTQSLASIVIGGIAFETPPDSSMTTPVEENSVFTLAESRAEALKHADTVAVPLILYFMESLRGLSIGAPVEFRGIPIGEVQSMNVEFDEAHGEFRFPVGITIYPGRLLALAIGDSKKVVTDDPAGRRARWNALTERGLRGQLRTGNLLTGQLYVALDFFPDAPKAQVDFTKTPPVIPTVQGTMTEVQETLHQLARRLEKVPLDQIGSDLRQTLRTLNRALESADKLVKGLDTDVSPAARTVLDDAHRTLNSANHMLASDAPLQSDMRETLREFSRAGRALRTLAEVLERHPEAVIRGKKEERR